MRLGFDSGLDTSVICRRRAKRFQCSGQMSTGSRTADLPPLNGTPSVLQLGPSCPCYHVVVSNHLEDTRQAYDVSSQPHFRTHDTLSSQESRHQQNASSQSNDGNLFDTSSSRYTYWSMDQDNSLRTTLTWPCLNQYRQHPLNLTVGARNARMQQEGRISMPSRNLHGFPVLLHEPRRMLPETSIPNRSPSSSPLRRGFWLDNPDPTASGFTSHSGQDSAAQQLIDSPIHFKLIVREQPLQARSCGNSSDRRSIDPTPIVELQIFDAEKQPIPPGQFCRHGYFLVVILCSEDGEKSMMGVSGCSSASAVNLEGNRSETAHVYKDEHGREACFFCFPNLSCREIGTYRLRFVLFRIPYDIPLNTSCPSLASVLSQPFKAVRAREFTGKIKQSALAVALRLQGANIPCSKGNSKLNAQIQPVHRFEEGTGDHEEREV